jgi:hypothetical protein
MIFNLMFFITALFYWYTTSHIIPALIGCLILLMFNEKFSFLSLLTVGVAISSIIFCFWLDYSAYQPDDDVLQHGVGIIYMLVLYIKAKKIFDNDEVSLD